MSRDERFEKGNMKNISKIRENSLAQILLEESLITQEHLDSAEEERNATGDLLIDILLKNEYVTEMELAKSLVKNYQLPFLHPQDYQINKDAKDLLPAAFLHTHKLYPIDIFGKTLAVITSGNIDEAIIKEIESTTGKEVALFVAPHHGLLRALAEFFPLDEITSELNDRMDELFGVP